MFGPLIIYFWSLQTTVEILTTNKKVKMIRLVFSSRDLTSRPLDHQSPPVTTRPGLTLHKNFLSMQSQFSLFDN